MSAPEPVWDLAVVGAGPAGASAALAALQAAPYARVLLVDRADFPRDKPCGDGLPPHALDVLAALGVTDVTAGYRPVSRLRLGYADGPVAERATSRPLYVVPRSVLDARLVAAAVARGAVLRRHRVRRVDVGPAAVVLDGQIAARVVVAADGAESVVRRRIGVPATPQRHVAVAIRGYAPVQPALAARQVLAFAERGWPAYAWSFPIGDGRANVGYGELVTSAALSQGRLLERLDALLPGAATNVQEVRAHRLPLSSGRPRQPDGRVLLAGDALSLINPMSGEGIFYAVLSGQLAGRVAVAAAGEGAGRAYRAELRRALGAHLWHTSLAAAVARRASVVRTCVRGAAGDQMVFDDLVELGLGAGRITPRLVRALLARPASMHACPSR